MRWSIKIARVMGIDVYVHVTFLLIVAYFFLARYLPHRSVSEGLYGLVFILLAFTIVVLHELGHTTAASWFGIKTKDITLYPIGGVASLERIPDDPKQELVVALAGPAVNVVLAGVLYLVLQKLPLIESLTNLEAYGDGQKLLEELFWVNVVLAGFNMIPAFPMDGGRVLRAILAMFMTPVQATNVAASLGQMFAFMMGLFGLLGGNPFLIFIAFFIWIAASQEAQMVSIKSSLTGVPVSDAMIRHYEIISPDAPLSKAIDLLLGGFQQDFPVVKDGRVLGILLRQDVIEKIRELGEHAPVQSAMRTEFVTADPYETLEKAFFKLQQCQCRSMPVLHKGNLVGLLTPDNVGEFIMLRDAVRAKA